MVGGPRQTSQSQMRDLSTMLLLLCLSALLALVSSQATISEYNRRVAIVSKLEELYQQYVDTYPDDKKGQILEEVMKNFEANFDGSDRWILDALTTDDTNGIVFAVMRQNFFDREATKAFLDTGKANFVAASEIHFRYYVEKGNFTAANSVRLLLQDAKQQMDAFTSRTLDFLAKVGTRQVGKDVDAVLSRHRESPSVLLSLRGFLKDAYGDRNWLVLAYRRGEEKKECFRQPTFRYHSDVLKDRTVVVVMVSSALSHDRKKADAMLDRVTDKYLVGYSCDGRPATIMKEAKYTCGADDYAFVGVYKESEGLPQVQSTHPGLVSTKTVFRAKWSFSCKANYHIIIFA